MATPVLTYFYGKRWYCSWVCGCGGLAETAGDPYRHLSDKSRAAWRWEVRIMYPILAIIVLITVLLWVNFAMNGSSAGRGWQRGLPSGTALLLAPCFRA